ncbi:MAG: SAM-dependent chlorinase/fluorinase [Deltaproteobacteria bacterium]|nr:SAM-dependent chlorinase/fluorinase [Deltaproteobacteria bacterium]
MPIIALTTDFGLEDAYVGIVKGVVLGLCPGATVVDVSHAVPPQDVLAGCLTLEAARPYFPPDTIHLAVVDPGVGTDRRALLAVTGHGSFLAPDNGLLSFLDAAEIRDLRSVENPAYRLRPVSRTFHGRDVFAPAAAHLAAGAPSSSFGPPLAEMVRLPLPRARMTPEGLAGTILSFDRFGNALTSIRAGEISYDARTLRVRDEAIPVVPTYASVSEGSPLALVGSSGRLEVAVRNGSARERLRLQSGDPVLLCT